MLGTAEALGVNLVDLFSTRRPRREPGIPGHDLHPADRVAVAWCGGEHLRDRLACKLFALDVFRRELRQNSLLLDTGRSIRTLVGGIAEPLGQRAIYLGR